MKRITLSLLSSLFTVSLSFGQHTTTETQTHTKDNYSIEYPENWELNTSGEMGSIFFLFSEISSEEDTFKENINLMIQDLTGHDLNLDQYVEISTGQIKTMIKDGSILESVRENKGDSEFHRMVFTGKQRTYNLKFEQRFWIKDNKAYVLTLTCEKDQFDAYSKTGRQILGSFKIQ